MFCLVGGSGVIVDMLILFLLADPHTLGWNVTVAKLVAAETALASNFVLNNIWTFRGSSHSQEKLKAVLRRFMLFNLICGIGILLNVGLLSLLYRYCGLNLYVSNFLSILMVTVWNFSMNAKFNWNH